MSGFSLVRTIPVQNTLGECILWDEETQCVWWTDIHESRLYRYRYAIEALETFACPERLCSFGFVAGDSRLVCAFASGFAADCGIESTSALTSLACGAAIWNVTTRSALTVTSAPGTATCCAGDPATRALTATKTETARITGR